jgi:hypothetical protein
MACPLKPSSPLFTRSEALQEMARWVPILSDKEMKKELVKVREAIVRWSLQIFYHLRQGSHFWWVGGGQRRSWPVSPSLRRPPRMSWGGGEKSHEGGDHQGGCYICDTSTARSAWRSPSPILRKTKNRKWLNYCCFILLGLSGFEVNTLCTIMYQHQTVCHHFLSWLTSTVQYLVVVN